jgi:hypothetical protein
MDIRQLLLQRLHQCRIVRTTTADMHALCFPGSDGESAGNAVRSQLQQCVLHISRNKSGPGGKLLIQPVEVKQVTTGAFGRREFEIIIRQHLLQQS